jgi:hypothetical protein
VGGRLPPKVHQSGPYGHIGEPLREGPSGSPYVGRVTRRLSATGKLPRQLGYACAPLAVHQDFLSVPAEKSVSLKSPHRMKRRGKKKPRSKTVILEGGTIDLSQLRNGPISVPVTVLLEQAYERPKGKKVITQVPSFSKAAPSELDLTLGQYDYLFAIDTNTRDVDGQIVSVTGVAGAKLEKREEGLTFRYRFLKCIEFWGVREHQERVGWLEVIDDLNMNPKPDPVHTGLIVDSYLGSLTAINRREEPVFGNTYLPKNMSLIYASSDVGNDSLANKMLALADKVAKELLAYVIATRPAVEMVSVAGKPYSGRRIWSKAPNR